MIAGVQILGIIFCIIMVYFSYVYYKRKNYGLRSLILWMAVWLGALFVVSFPKTLYGIMEALKIQRTADFLTLLGFAFFAVITFYLYIIVKKNNRKMELLVRELAMKDAESRKTRKKREIFAKRK
ncbi:MAG: DUF2304 domain-containing protein [Candidatus Nanoarchaeia archaeon]